MACCCCGHDHEHEHNHEEEHEEELSLKKIILSAVFFIAGIIVEKVLAPVVALDATITRGIFLALYLNLF